jgi:hypothetical protein
LFFKKLSSRQFRRLLFVGDGFDAIDILRKKKAVAKLLCSFTHC